jgi:exopolysaccharide biosynthesis polyprenyl glycosylphosphotransferase
LYELSINRAKVTQAGDSLLYEINSIALTLEQRVLKRTFDLLISIVALILFLPIILLISIIIKLYDGGPVFFKQERITINNKKFTLYKFRSMIINAEDTTGPVLSSLNDDRVTKVGKVLRKLRLDELPQLFNIILGDMSVVGPRPEREFFVKQFQKENIEYEYRLNVKAGVTGLAQAMGNYSTSFADKLKFDIYYINNYSMLNDFVILLHTIRSMFDPDSSKGVTETQSLEKCLENEGFFIFRTTDDFIKIIIKK